jgi:anti-sigma28 factor (negative regulator of flagellin synthesis)
MTKTKAKLGRPVNKKSARQIRLAQLAKKRANGTLKLGRPVEKDSVRQKRIAELEAKRADGTLKLGRPVDKTSARQKKLARVARLAKQGIVVKRGRPVGSGKKETVEKPEVVEIVTVKGA